MSICPECKGFPCAPACSRRFGAPGRTARRPTSPNAREAARIVTILTELVSYERHGKAQDLQEWAALLSPQGGTPDIAAIVETYTDILSPETARKVASRIRSISPQGGERAALQELMAAREAWDEALGSGTQKARERAERRVLRAWEGAKAALSTSSGE